MLYVQLAHCRKTIYTKQCAELSLQCQHVKIVLAKVSACQSIYDSSSQSIT